MTEVTNLDISNMSSSEVKKYNKEVKELQDSIKQLDNLRTSLENKIQVSDNSIISTIISQIESTKQFALKTIEKGEITQESNRKVLRDSYDAIKELLRENRKENVINSNNQIVTLKDILNEYKNETKQQQGIEVRKQEKLKSSLSNSQNLLDSNLIKGAETTASLSAELLSSTPIGMLVNSAIKPTKQLGGILKDLTKGTINTSKSIGSSIGNLFKSPTSLFTTAKSLEDKKKQTEKKEKKDTDTYRKHVTDKLDEISKKSGKGGKDDEGMSILTKLLLGGLAAGVAGWLWREYGDQIKTAGKKYLVDPVVNYVKDNFPKTTKFLKKAADATESVINKAKDIIDNSPDAIKSVNDMDINAGEVIDIDKSDGLLKRSLKKVANFLLTPGAAIGEFIAKAVAGTEELNKPRFSASTLYKESGDKSIDILNYLKSKGYTDEAAAGIYGNIMQESRGNPLAHNKAGGDKGAFGLFQWRGQRQDDLKAYAEERGLDYTDWKTQIDFAIQEEKGKIAPEIMNKFRNSEDAARYVRDKFERSGETDFHKGGAQRLKYSKEGMILLDKYKDITPARDIRLAEGAPSILSADALNLQLDQNRLLYEDNSRSSLLGSNLENNQNISQLFGNLNNSLSSGFGTMSEALKNSTSTSLNNSQPDDPAMLIINAGGA